MEYTALSNGVRLPMVGYGTFQLPPGSMCEQCVSNALEAGYRLFDTAASYGNEKSVDYIAAIRMVDNYLTAFDMEEELAQDKQVEAQAEHLRVLPSLRPELPAEGHRPEHRGQEPAGPLPQPPYCPAGNYRSQQYTGKQAIKRSVERCKPSH